MKYRHEYKDHKGKSGVPYWMTRLTVRPKLALRAENRRRNKAARIARRINRGNK